MNTRHPMIIIKGEIKTSEVKYCEYSHNSHKWEVQFNTDKTYSYVYDNVKKLFNPKALEPGRYKVGRDGRIFLMSRPYMSLMMIWKNTGVYVLETAARESIDTMICKWRSRA